MIIPFPNAPFIHFLLEFLAFFVGIRLYYFLKRKNTLITDENRLWILLGAMFGALIGSRLFAVFEVPELLSQQTFLSIYQSKTVAGGFAGGLWGVELTKKIIGEKTASGDLYIFPILIALIIGRIGCFGMGTLEPTYGIETTFFAGMNLGDGKFRHPIALYEIVFLLILMSVFYLFKNKKMVNGDKFKIFMLAYFSYRFAIEFFKPFHPLFLGLSSIHWLSILIFIHYSPFLKRIITKNHAQ